MLSPYTIYLSVLWSKFYRLLPGGSEEDLANCASSRLKKYRLKMKRINTESKFKVQVPQSHMLNPNGESSHFYLGCPFFTCGSNEHIAMMHFSLSSASRQSIVIVKFQKQKYINICQCFMRTELKVVHHKIDHKR